MAVVPASLLSVPGPGGVTVPGVSFAALSAATLRPLLLPWRPPCLSLALPTHRRVPGNRVDLPRFRHLVTALRTALEASQPPAEVARLLAPLATLAAERRFWEFTREGLVVLAADGAATAFVLEEPVAPCAHVGEHFHTADLVRLVAAARPCRVLTLSSREARLYALADHGLEPFPFPGGDVAAGRTVLGRGEFVDAETFQPHRVRRGLGAAGAIHGGTGSRLDDTRADTERFFRAVAEAAHEPGGPPLLLVALPGLEAIYRSVCHDDRLLAEAVALDPQRVPVDDLHRRMQPLLARIRQRDVEATLDTFRSARAHDRGTSDVAAIARAAVAGNVRILLVEAGRRIPGTLDRSTGEVRFAADDATDPSLRGDGPAAAVEDLVGAIAATVLLHGGEIVAVDRMAMPADTGLAAIERHPDG